MPARQLCKQTTPHLKIAKVIAAISLPLKPRPIHRGRGAAIPEEPH